GADHVARREHRVARRLREQRIPLVEHRREIAARALLAVDTRDHLAARAVELVRRDEDRPERRREVLAFRRAEPDAHLRPLDVARRPVVHHGEPADLPVRADHRGALELVVELLRSFRVRHRLVVRIDRVRVREVEDRDLVPLGRNLAAALPSRVRDVLLERHEVAHGRWAQDGRAQVDVGQRVLGVLTRRPASGEERLQRLRRELDDAVALDAPRPPALERQLLRREHAQLHGSVWTITSAMSGRSRRMRSSIVLARACASSSVLLPSRPSVRNATRPPSVRRKRSSRGSTPVVSRTIRRTTAAPSASTSRPDPSSVNGSRCVCTPAISGTATRIAASSCSATWCASSSESLPGSFTCSESSVRPPTSSSVMLWTSRTRGTAIAAACARSRRPTSSSGSTWTTTSAFGSARSTAASTASAAACPCPTAAVGGTPITTSANWRPPACLMRRRRSSTAGCSVS